MAALRNWKMDNILNLVYDEWDEINNEPIPNGLKNYDGYVVGDLVRSDVSLSCFNFLKVKNYRLSDVEKYPDKKFYYHIWNRSLFSNNFFDNAILPINLDVIEFIKNNKNLDLIFANESETERVTGLQSLNNILKSLEIDRKKVWFIHNGVISKENELKLKDSINFYSTKHIIMTMKHWPWNIKYKPIKDKNNFFLCLNRSNRIHRYCILSLLKQSKILEDTNWSLIQGYNFDKNNLRLFSDIFKVEDVFDLLDEIIYFYQIDTRKSNYETNESGLDNRTEQIIPLIEDTFENSYVNIVTETFFLEDEIHISEKSFKPFAFYQFPLILASYEHLKYFKKTYPDLDLFDDIIDHSYDDEPDPRNRLFKFMSEIKRIHENKEFFIEFYKNNEHRFIANRNFIKNYENKDDTIFFKKLINNE